MGLARFQELEDKENELCPFCLKQTLEVRYKLRPGEKRYDYAIRLKCRTCKMKYMRFKHNDSINK